MQPMPTLAALVTFYHGTDATELRRALDSLAAQTRPAEEVLIIQDGPAPAAAVDVARDFAHRTPGARLVSLPTNQGSGPALAAGIAGTEADLVAVLDSDDVAAPERFAVQLDFFAAHPEVDVVGSSLREFDQEVARTTGSLEKAAAATGNAIRSLPEEHADIARYARINSPVNHPTAMMRRATVVAAGGYQPVAFLEDYDLWARILARGGRFHNLAQPLTWFAVSPAQRKRRSSFAMIRGEWAFQRRLISYGLITRGRGVLNFVLRNAYRLLPRPAVRLAYSLLFHRRAESTTDRAA